MARPLRVEYPGAFYHVMNRGNAGEGIFPADAEKKKFLDCLQQAVRRYSLRIHAYCLMTNHYHLLLETPEANLSRAVHWINVSYAGWYNRRHRRSGHLFQGRFKALIIEADAYLTALSRYIHLNPVRAGMTHVPEAYPWSSCSDFLGERPTPEWLQTEQILAGFHPCREQAVRGYRDYLAAEPRTENPNTEAAAGIVLGRADFVEWIKNAHLADRESDQEVPQLRQLRRSYPEDVIKAVRAEFGGAEERVLQKGGKNCVDRLVAIGLVRELCGMKGDETGRYFGGITGAAVTLAGKKFESEIAKDADLRRRVESVRKALRLKI